MKKSLKKKLTAILTSLLLLIALTVVSMVTDVLDAVLAPEEPAQTPAPTSATQPAETAPQETTVPPADSTGLTVHFIDVGQADSMLLECDGKFMLIDAGNVGDGQLVVSYLQQQGVEQLQTVIVTHAHEDHVGGMAAVMAVFPVEKVYCPTKVYSSRCFDDFMHYVDQQRLTVTDPVPGDVFMLGSAEVTILGPVRSYAETNDTSIVCRVVYGSNSFLFTGDMEREAELEMLDSGAYVKSDVLKVGHHGSDTSSSYRFIREVDPEYAVIPVGTDNDYGHPHNEPMSRLRHAGMTIFRTDLMGSVVAYSDGIQIVFTWDNQSVNPELAQYTGIYVGNKNSLRVHSEECGSLPSANNRVEFATLEEALEAGYSPCTGCLD